MNANSPEAEQLALKTDNQRAGLIESAADDGAKSKAQDKGNAVEKELERKEEVGEVSKLWDNVWSAVNAAREVAEKRAEEADGKDDAVAAYRQTLGELIAVLEGMKNEDDPFTAMKQRADEMRLAA